MIRAAVATLLVGLVAAPEQAIGPEPNQPKVAPGPNEPDLAVVLDKGFGLGMYADLRNPVRAATLDVPGLFRRAAAGPVLYTPIIALGLETTNRGGWYRPGPDAARPDKHPLWSYKLKQTAADFADGLPRPPKLGDGSKVEFDPGDAPFGLWVANDGLDQSDAYTEPKVVAAVNPRLRKQPYKAMIYPMKDRATGRLVPHSYLIGWEYSTNDDFQDIVARLDNVVLIGSP